MSPRAIRSVRTHDVVRGVVCAARYRKPHFSWRGVPGIRRRPGRTNRAPASSCRCARVARNRPRSAHPGSRVSGDDDFQTSSRSLTSRGSQIGSTRQYFRIGIAPQLPVRCTRFMIVTCPAALGRALSLPAAAGDAKYSPDALLLACHPASPQHIRSAEMQPSCRGDVAGPRFSECGFCQRVHRLLQASRSKRMSTRVPSHVVLDRRQSSRDPAYTETGGPPRLERSATIGGRPPPGAQPATEWARGTHFLSDLLRWRELLVLDCRSASRQRISRCREVAGDGVASRVRSVAACHGVVGHFESV